MTIINNKYNELFPDTTDKSASSPEISELEKFLRIQVNQETYQETPHYQFEDKDYAITDNITKMSETQYQEFLFSVAKKTKDAYVLRELTKIANENETILFALIQNEYYKTQENATNLIVKLAIQHSTFPQRLFIQLKKITNETNVPEILKAIEALAYAMRTTNDKMAQISHALLKLKHEISNPTENKSDKQQIDSFKQLIEQQLMLTEKVTPLKIADEIDELNIEIEQIKGGIKALPTCMGTQTREKLLQLTQQAIALEQEKLQHHTSRTHENIFTIFEPSFSEYSIYDARNFQNDVDSLKQLAKLKAEKLYKRLCMGELISIQEQLLTVFKEQNIPRSHSSNSSQPSTASTSSTKSTCESFLYPHQSQQKQSAQIDFLNNSKSTINRNLPPSATPSQTISRKNSARANSGAFSPLSQNCARLPFLQPPTAQRHASSSDLARRKNNNDELKKSLENKITQYINSRGSLNGNKFSLKCRREWLTPWRSATLTKLKGESAVQLLKIVNNPSSSKMDMIHAIIQDQEKNNNKHGLTGWTRVVDVSGDYGIALNDCLNLLTNDANKPTFKEIKNFALSSLNDNRTSRNLDATNTNLNTIDNLINWLDSHNNNDYHKQVINTLKELKTRKVVDKPKSSRSVSFDLT